MLQRGRKSSNGMALIPSLTRLDPPADLSRDERKVWRDVVQSKPADWFDRDTAYLLMNFCRHVVTAQRLTQQLAAVDPADLATFDKLLRMRAAETKSLLSLATAMRISQHAQHKADTAGTQSSLSSSDTPWQSRA